MRVTTYFKRLLDLPAITVSKVEFYPARLVVTVKLRKKKLSCPKCDFVTKARYDTRPVPSVWRHLDLGKWRLDVQADLRLLGCSTHGVITEGVPFARANSHFTRDFENNAWRQAAGVLCSFSDEPAEVTIRRLRDA